MEIKETVQQVAEAIAAVLKVEVEIIDTEHNRIGGTPSVLSLGRKQQWGYVNEHVIKTRQHFVLTNPGSHTICQVCELKNNCYCKVGIFCPINYEDKCIGIINLMGFDTHQQRTLLENTEKYMEFLVHMASLLSSKVAEHKTLKTLLCTKKQLEVIVNALHEGIIAVDENCRITCINKKGARMLGVIPSEVIGQPITNFFPEFDITGGNSKGPQIVQVFVDNKKISLLCSIYPIISRGKIIGAVQTFQDYKVAHKQAYKLTANNYIMYTFDDIIGTSKVMMEAKEKARQAAQGFFTILIEGESGTGKELFARAIHNESPFREGPFVPINCSAIPESLLESELFGYEPGAFTGARAGGKPGKFELADGGTLFLDEIGEFPLHLQAKLLRVLEDRVVERVGGTKPRPINARIIAATNRNLFKMVESGEFRADLYYRLSTIPISIPALRERKEDIPVLLEYLLNKYVKMMKKKVKGFTSDAINLLINYPWPGNVRELENTVEYAVCFTNDEWISINNLPQRIQKYHAKLSEKEVDLKSKKLQVERETILELLEKYGTSVEGKNKIAQVLGISRATLYRKIKKLGLNTSSR